MEKKIEDEPWVVVSNEGVFKYESFKKALESKAKGHVMSERYYEYHYKNDLVG